MAMVMKPMVLIKSHARRNRFNGMGMAPVINGLVSAILRFFA